MTFGKHFHLWPTYYSSSGYGPENEVLYKVVYEHAYGRKPLHSKPHIRFSVWSLANQYTSCSYRSRTQLSSTSAVANADGERWLSAPDWDLSRIFFSGSLVPPGPVFETHYWSVFCTSLTGSAFCGLGLHIPVKLVVFGSLMASRVRSK